MKVYELPVIGTYVLYLLIVILAPLCLRNLSETKSNKAKWFMTWLILTIPAALRYMTGRDWPLYEDAYNVIIKSGNFLSASYNIENSFKFLSYISNKLTGSSVILFGAYAALSNLFALIGIYRFKDHVSCSWSVFIYSALTYFTMYNISRQFLAIMIVFAGYREILDRKFFKYLIWVALASLFHATAVLTLVLYVYGWATNSGNRYRQLVNFALYILPVVGILMINEVMPVVSKLLNNAKYDSYEVGSIESIGLGAVVQLATGAGIYFGLSQKQIDVGYKSFCLRTYVLALVLFMLQYAMANYGGRVYLYFIPVQILLIGSVMKGMELRVSTGRLKATLPQLFLLGFTLLQLVHSMITNAQKHVPYSFRLPW